MVVYGPEYFQVVLWSEPKPWGHVHTLAATDFDVRAKSKITRIFNLHFQFGCTSELFICRAPVCSWRSGCFQSTTQTLFVSHTNSYEPLVLCLSVFFDKNRGRFWACAPLSLQNSTKSVPGGSVFDSTNHLVLLKRVVEPTDRLCDLNGPLDHLNGADNAQIRCRSAKSKSWFWVTPPS